jgi:hypothetical protein
MIMRSMLIKCVAAIKAAANLMTRNFNLGQEVLGGKNLVNEMTCG